MEVAAKKMSGALIAYTEMEIGGTWTVKIFFHKSLIQYIIGNCILGKK